MLNKSKQYTISAKLAKHLRDLDTPGFEIRSNHQGLDHNSMSVLIDLPENEQDADIFHRHLQKIESVEAKSLSDQEIKTIGGALKQCLSSIKNQGALREGYQHVKSALGILSASIVGFALLFVICTCVFNPLTLPLIGLLIGAALAATAITLAILWGAGTANVRQQIKHEQVELRQHCDTLAQSTSRLTSPKPNVATPTVVDKNENAGANHRTTYRPGYAPTQNANFYKLAPLADSVPPTADPSTAPQLKTSNLVI